MKKKRVISNIILLGLVSLFIDMSTEMVYPLVPLFLTSTLGASPAIVGIIEGIAESIASLLKVFSGYIGDVSHKNGRCGSGDEEHWPCGSQIRRDRNGFHQ